MEKSVGLFRLWDKTVKTDNDLVLSTSRCITANIKLNRKGYRIKYGISVLDNSTWNLHLMGFLFSTAFSEPHAINTDSARTISNTLSYKTASLLSPNRLDRLATLLETPDNWNSQGAKALNLDSIQCLNRFCDYLASFNDSEPAMTLTDDGELELTLFFPSMDVCLLFRPDMTVGVHIEDISSDFLFANVDRLDFFKSMLQARHFVSFKND